MKKLWVFVGCLSMVMLVILSSGLCLAKPTEINFYMWADPTYESIVKAFNESQSQIVVKANIIPSADYETKIITVLSGGAKLDCYMQKRQTDIFPQYSNGFIQPLDKLIKKYKYDVNNFKSYLPQVTVNGKIAAIPFRGGAYYTYYNKKIFEKAGIPTPTDYVKKGEWTWDKFAEVAKTLSTGDGQQYGGVLYTWMVCSMGPVIQSQQDMIKADGTPNYDPKMILYALKLRKDLEQCKAIIPQAELTATKLHYSTAFYGGNVAMLVIGEWFPGQMMAGRDKNLLQNYTWNDWAVTRMPCNNSTYSTLGTATFCHVYSRSKKKDAAFKFISWLGGPQGAAIVAKAGFLPPFSTPQVEEALSSVIPDKESVKYFTEPAARVSPTYNKYGSKVEALLNVIIQKYLTTDVSDKDIMDEFDNGVKDIIKTTK